MSYVAGLKKMYSDIIIITKTTGTETQMQYACLSTAYKWQCSNIYIYDGKMAVISSDSVQIADRPLFL